MTQRHDAQGSDPRGTDVTCPDKLIHKANQIAAFFAPYPEDRAITDLADHLNKFWTPAMRKQFLHILEASTDQFHPLLGKAKNQIQPGS